MRRATLITIVVLALLIAVAAGIQILARDPVPSPPPVTPTAPGGA